MSEQRRTVTVVFCDLAGSTALGESVDPERLLGELEAEGHAAVLREHRRVLREAFAAHGGVEVGLVIDDGYVGGDVHRAVTSPPAAMAATSSLRHHCRPRAAK